MIWYFWVVGWGGAGGLRSIGNARILMICMVLVVEWGPESLKYIELLICTKGTEIICFPGHGNLLISALAPKMPAQPPHNPRTTSRTTSSCTPQRFETLLASRPSSVHCFSLLSLLFISFSLLFIAFPCFSSLFIYFQRVSLLFITFHCFSCLIIAFHCFSLLFITFHGFS